MGEGKARAWRVPLNLPSFSRGEENGMLWERQAGRPQEQAARSRAVAATTNRCGRQRARGEPHAGRGCRPSARRAPKPPGNRSLGFPCWARERCGVWTGRTAGEEGRKDLWDPNLHQCGSGMSNREVGLLPPSAGVSAPGNAL